MMPSTNIVIGKNKLKQIGLTIASAFFVIIGYLMVFGNIESSRHPPLFVMAFGILGILFFGLAGLLLFIDLLKFRPALVINDKGVTNYSHAGGGYIIDWNNIGRLKTKTVFKQRFIIIGLKDTDKVYKHVGPLTKGWMKLNHKYYDSPVFIPENVLKIDIEELLILLRESKKKYKSKSQKFEGA